MDPSSPGLPRTWWPLEEWMDASLIEDEGVRSYFLSLFVPPFQDEAAAFVFSFAAPPPERDALACMPPQPPLTEAAQCCICLAPAPKCTRAEAQLYDRLGPAAGLVAAFLGEARGVAPQCGHVFHDECVSQWMLACAARGRSITCPLCRRALLPHGAS